MKTKAKKTRKTGATKKSKATQAAKLDRVGKVYEWLLSGMPRADILQYASAEWHLTERQTDTYIAEATGLIKHQAAQTRDENFAEQVALRRLLRSKATEANDFRLALDVAKDEAKLLDLYPAEKSKIETNVPILLTIDQ